jgi:hypothetical protein
MPKYLVDVELSRQTIRTFTIECEDPSMINELAIDVAMEFEWPPENDSEEMKVLYFFEEEPE